MKFKVGDKVKIVDEVKNLALETPFGTVIIDKNSYPWLKKWLGKVVTIDTAHDGYYTTLEIKGYYLNDEMIEGLAEEETKPNVIEEAKTYWDSIKDAWICPDGYEFRDENGNVINATKIVLEKKKKEYPKTYCECKDILGLWDIDDTERGYYKTDLIDKLQMLLICRDAYWKIAGEEMGLGEPWKPGGENTFGIFYDRLTDEIEEQNGYHGANSTLEFPTEEMRDAFYENFKALINECKELL